MEKLVNIDEGHIGLLLDCEGKKDRREAKEGKKKKKKKTRWVPLVVLSHNEMRHLFVFAFLDDKCLKCDGFD